MQKMLTFIDSTEDFDLIDTKKINSSKIFSFNINFSLNNINNFFDYKSKRNNIFKFLKSKFCSK